MNKSNPKSSVPIKILIGILTSGTMIHIQTMRDTISLLNHTKSLRRLGGSGKYATIIAYSQGACIHTGRNKVCSEALKIGADYVLMLDSDMAFPKNALETLLDLDKDIISAFAVRKDFPFFPVMSNRRDNDNNDWFLDIIGEWEDGELLKVDSVGTAFLLFKTDVLRQIEMPYFHYSFNKDIGLDVGSDNYFCLKAGEAGFDVFVDTSLKIGHIGDYTATIDDYHACRAVPAKVKEAKSA